MSGRISKTCLRDRSEIQGKTWRYLKKADKTQASAGAITNTGLVAFAQWRYKIKGEIYE